MEWNSGSRGDPSSSTATGTTGQGVDKFVRAYVRHERSGQNPGMDTFDPELLELLKVHTPAGTVINTLVRDKPNRIVELGPEGVTIQTERSGEHPQLVPAWMIQTAWDHLIEHGELTNHELLATDGLNVKRSSAVCALLARLPDVTVGSSSPVTLKFASRRR